MRKCSTLLARRRVGVFSFQHEDFLRIVRMGFVVVVFHCGGPQTACGRVWKMDNCQVDGGKRRKHAHGSRIRPLFVDGRTKEFTTGTAHDVTDRIFVVQRVYRLNDLLPQEAGPNRWRWERGGWLLVDRISGRAQPVPLPAFDAYYSEVSWFRDYAA